jgi:cell division protein FtsA
MLSAPLAAAERIKTLYGSALGELDAAADLIEVPLMGEEGERASERVRRSVLTRIIQARLEEIFGEVQGRLVKSGFDVAAGRRAVLTGGSAQLAGTREMAARYLNKQVRIGRPQTFPGLPAATAGPAYATALGLLISGATSPPESNDPNPPQAEEKPRRGFMRWVNDNLFG